ncbi:MAG: PAS domain S-box protein [Desulfopila sp.]
MSTIMNYDLFINLVCNAAVLLSLGLIYDVFYRSKRQTSTSLNQGIFGVIIGLVAIALMATPANWVSGIIFDTRTILLGLSGLFFGSIPTFVAMAIAAAYRLNLGGSGALTGVVTILSSGLIGLVWRHYRFRESKQLSFFEMYLFGVVVHLFMILCMFLLPQDIMQRTIKAIILPVMLIYPACTALLGNLLTSRQRRIRIEDDLITSENLHRTILQTAMSGIWRTNMQGQLLEVNEAYCRMSGYSKQELLTMRISDIEVNQTHEETVAGILKTKKQGASRFESRHRCKNGVVIDVEVSIQFLAVDGQQYVAFLRDITERKRVERELQESRKQYHDLVEGTPDLIAKVDLMGRFTFVNHAANKIFGLSPEDCIGRLAFDFIHPEDQEATIKAFNGWIQSKEEVFILENRQVSTDGREHLMAWSARAEYGEDGTIVGFAGTARDITEMKRSEAERGKLESQFHQSQKIESVGQLAGGVAHDFNNMLGVILGRSELALLHMDPAQPHYQDLLEIHKAAEHSAALTRQLLAFARKQTIAPRIIDLNETVEGMLKMLRRLIGEDIDLTWRPAKDVAPIKMDPTQLDQILANLCVNARDAITGVGKLIIETGRVRFDEEYCADHAGFIPGTFIMLAVSDNGCGMNPETISHLFEPFFTTKEQGKGTGLGLASVYGAVKQNNGFINVYSEPGQGTTFRIYLPLHQAGTQLQADKVMAQPASRGNETILLVEDEPAILRLATMMLEKQGYVVIAATTPGEAIRLAHEYSGSIDLLMTDVVMPEMNGRDLAKKLLSIYPGIKRLFMSGYTANVIAHHGVLDEGVYFIQKPFSSKDLGAKLRAILENGVAS